MASFTRGITFATNGTITAENLHNLIDQTTPRAGIITDRSVLTTMSTGDRVLIADTDDATNAYFITTGSLVGQALSGATYDGGSFTAGTIATFNSTTGTVTRLTSSTATISTLSGNTTGGTFSGNIVATAGTVTTLTASTLTGALSGGTYSGNIIATVGTFSGLLNSSTGTFSGAINSTIGTIGALNSTTGTIGNFTTTLAGDFTISNGTGTLGTTGVTAGTYGTSTIIPQITVDAKGRITSVGTSAIGSSGKLLQVAKATTASVITCGTAIPWDDTIPQNTEGNEVLTISITPISATSTIYLKFICTGNPNGSSGANGIMAALFKDSDANAISVFGVPSNGANWQTSVQLSHAVASGGTTARTYKIRVGMNANTFYVNGNNTGTRVFGGASIAIFEAWEVEA